MIQKLAKGSITVADNTANGAVRWEFPQKPEHLREGVDYEFLRRVNGLPISWKVTEPITVSFLGRRDQETEIALAKAVAMLNDASRLKLRIINEDAKAAQADIELYYVDCLQGSYSNNQLGQTVTRSDSEGVITSATIKLLSSIRGDNSLLTRIIAHELGHGLGLGHPSVAEGEIMAAYSELAKQPHDLGPGDKYALRYLGILASHRAQRSEVKRGEFM